MACGTVGDLPQALGLNPTNHTFASRTPMQNESCHRRFCSITKGEVQYEDWWVHFNVCWLLSIPYEGALTGTRRNHMPVAYIDLQSGLKRDTKKKLVTEVAEAIHHAYMSPDTRVYLREGARERNSGGGQLGATVGP